MPTLTLHLPSGSDLLINKIKIILKKVLFLKLFFNTKTIRKIYNFFLNKIIPNSQQNFLQNLKQFLKNHVFADFKKIKILSFSTTPLFNTIHIVNRQMPTFLFNPNSFKNILLSSNIRVKWRLKLNNFK